MDPKIQANAKPHKDGDINNWGGMHLGGDWWGEWMWRKGCKLTGVERSNSPLVRTECGHGAENRGWVGELGICIEWIIEDLHNPLCV